jgi:hypothetical protein
VEKPTSLGSLIMDAAFIVIWTVLVPGLTAAVMAFLFVWALGASIGVNDGANRIPMLLMRLCPLGGLLLLVEGFFLFGYLRHSRRIGRDLALPRASRHVNRLRPSWPPRGTVVDNARRVPIPPMTLFGYSKLMELIFEIRDAEEGGFYARALGHGIFTEADSWDELRANVLEAVSLHFEGAATRPRLVQMHYVKDELIPVEAA